MEFDTLAYVPKKNLRKHTQTHTEADQSVSGGLAVDEQ